MGHARLRELPRTRKWTQVVELLGGGAGASDVAVATLAASEKGLEEGSLDAGLVRAFWLLTQIPLCARSGDFAEELRRRGMPVSDEPSLMELAGAYADAIDAHVRRRGRRTDLGEMALLAGAECLTAVVGERTPSLFGTTPEDVQREVAGLATSRQFSRLARGFFTRLLDRYLTSFLSCEIANHVGGDGRFANVDEHTEFSAAVNLHCGEAAQIIEDFAGGWFSKTNYEGAITQEKAAGFVHVALGKLRDELAIRGRADE